MASSLEMRFDFEQLHCEPKVLVSKRITLLSAPNHVQLPTADLGRAFRRSVRLCLNTLAVQQWLQLVCP